MNYTVRFRSYDSTEKDTSIKVAARHSLDAVRQAQIITRKDVQTVDSIEVENDRGNKFFLRPDVVKALPDHSNNVFRGDAWKQAPGDDWEDSEFAPERHRWEDDGGSIITTASQIQPEPDEM